MRVVAFGILLEVSNSSHSKEVKEEVRAVLSGNEGILMEMLGSDLEGVATASLEAIKGMVSFISICYSLRNFTDKNFVDDFFCFLFFRNYRIQ